jgi:hypothetical protein
MVALQSANILRSEQVIAMSVGACPERSRMGHSRVYRTAKKVAANAAILKRFAEIDKILLQYDRALHEFYQKLLPLHAPPLEPTRRQIGFSASR